MTHPLSTSNVRTFIINSGDVNWACLSTNFPFAHPTLFVNQTVSRNYVIWQPTVTINSYD